MREKRNSKFKVMPLLALCLTAVMCFSVWAAEDRTKITSIRLSISSSIEAGSYDGDIAVTTTSDKFTVGEVELQNDEGEWGIGDTPRAKVWLYAESGQYFSSTASRTFTFTGDDASFVSAKTEDDKTVMVLTFKLDKLEGDLEIEEAEWDNERGVGYWSSTDGANSYQVRLYRGSSSVTSAITVNDTTYNFAGHITRTGDYSFRVRAIGSGSKRGEWIESDNWYIDEEILAYLPAGGSGGGSGVTTGGSWQQNGVGWWYRNADGSWPANSWLYINNYWYYFKGDGYMATGWIQLNNTWYYCDTSTGAMYANRRTPDGLTVGADGAWLGY